MLLSAKSDLETRRIRRFGRNAVCYLLADTNDPNGYQVLATLTSHFDVVRENNSEVGGLESILVFEETASVNAAQIGNKIEFVDVVPTGNAADGYERYLAKTETAPTTRDRRWYVRLVMESGNRTPIVF